MKSNVDLTERGHFSEGWMPGGWRARGIFRKRKPMKTSQKFKDILKMGDDKPYGVSSLISKLFGIAATLNIGYGNIVNGDITLSVGGGQLTSGISTGNWTTATTASSDATSYWQSTT